MIHHQSHQTLNLVIIWSLVPLLHKEVFDHLGQSGQHPAEVLTLTVLADDVEEPVLEVVSVGRLEHLPDEGVVPRVSIEHVDADAGVQSCDLVPVEGWDEQHLPRLQDTVLTCCRGEAGVLSKIWTITVDLTLYCFTLRSKTVGIQIIKIITKQSHLLPE